MDFASTTYGWGGGWYQLGSISQSISCFTDINTYNILESWFFFCTTVYVVVMSKRCQTGDGKPAKIDNSRSKW